MDSFQIYLTVQIKALIGSQSHNIISDSSGNSTVSCCILKRGRQKDAFGKCSTVIFIKLKKNFFFVVLDLPTERFMLNAKHI